VRKASLLVRLGGRRRGKRANPKRLHRGKGREGKSFCSLRRKKKKDETDSRKILVYGRVGTEKEDRPSGLKGKREEKQLSCQGRGRKKVGAYWEEGAWSGTLHLGKGNKTKSPNS